MIRQSKTLRDLAQEATEDPNNPAYGGESANPSPHPMLAQAIPASAASPEDQIAGIMADPDLSPQQKTNQVHAVRNPEPITESGPPTVAQAGVVPGYKALMADADMPYSKRREMGGPIP